MNPDPRLFAPDDTARQMEVVGCDHQREAFGDADGEPTSSAAPFSEKLRIVQSKVAPPPNVILPAFKNRRLGAVLCSSIIWTSAVNRAVFDGRSYYPVTAGVQSSPIQRKVVVFLGEFHQFKGIGCPSAPAGPRSGSPGR